MSLRTRTHRAAIAIVAASLVTPAATFGASDRPSAPHFPTARQVAMHQGTLAQYRQATRSPRFPSARQIAMHQGRLPEDLSAAPAASESGQSGDALPIVLSSVAAVVALTSVGVLVAARRRAAAFR